jgi:hypothetical protein
MAIRHADVRWPSARMFGGVLLDSADHLSGTAAFQTSAALPPAVIFNIEPAVKYPDIRDHLK